jgi:hypothetical protein
VPHRCENRYKWLYKISFLVLRCTRKQPKEKK